jgi:hypothetical protein
MNVMLFTFAFFLFIVAIMAIGYVIAGKSIKGSCGGLNAIEGLNGACDICEIRSQCSKRKRMASEREKQMQA